MAKKKRSKRSKTSSETDLDGPLRPRDIAAMHYHISWAEHAHAMREILERNGSLGDDSVVLFMLSEIAVKHACEAAPLIISYYERNQEAW